MTDFWVVFTKEGEQLIWARTIRNRLFRRWPKPQDGMVKLDSERPYVIDPARFIRERTRTPILRLPRTDVYQYWLEDEPDPIQLSKRRCTMDHNHCDTLTLGSYATGSRMQAYAKAQHIGMILNEGPNWIAIIAVLAIMGLIGAMAALYFAGNR